MSLGACGLPPPVVPPRHPLQLRRQQLTSTGFIRRLLVPARLSLELDGGVLGGGDTVSALSVECTVVRIAVLVWSTLAENGARRRITADAI
jgi:hypothetical protein